MSVFINAFTLSYQNVFIYVFIQRKRERTFLTDVLSYRQALLFRRRMKYQRCRTNNSSLFGELLQDYILPFIYVEQHTAQSTATDVNGKKDDKQVKRHYGLIVDG